ncbi:MAG: carbohydrate ABC transporter permease [Streptococcaceae bacterium]|jgi:raffinose/stachyose/melibiose transport system permease protein|nr:carbohydrate ABC transporter permease [Streptococcaceae bacterium]
MQKKSTKFILIAVGVVVSLLWIYPFWLMLINSFKNQTEIFASTLSLPKTLDLSNYSLALQQLDFGKTLFSSLFVTIGSLVLLIFASSMAAYALSRNNKRLSKTLYLIIAVGLLIPFQGIMIPLVSIFGKFNALNRPALMFMYLGLGTSMATFLYYGALQSIPRSLDEAAIIDGASPWKVYWKVVFPLLKPTTVTVVVLNSLWFWNDYLLPSITINKPGMLTIPLKTFYFFGQFSKQWNLALAALVVVVLPLIILFVFLQKYVVKGIADGAVK